MFVVESIVDGRIIRTDPMPKVRAEKFADSIARNPTVEHVRVLNHSRPGS